MSDQPILPPEIVEGLTRLRSAAQGPFGPPPFRALVRNHFELFGALQRLGASWRQIAGLLANAGIAGNSGKPISEAVLRATLSAARKQAGPSAPDARQTDHPGPGNPRRNEAQRNGTRYPETKCIDAKRTEPGRRETVCNETQRLERQRADTQRNEQIRNETQRTRQADAAAVSLHAIVPARTIEGSPHDPAPPRPPPSGRIRRPPPALDDQLLQRAARIRHLKEEHHG